jgi:hypothetical protein
MATNEELQALAEQAVNPGAMATPSPAPNASVIGTPEGPGIPPIAPVPTEAAPMVNPAAPPILPQAGVPGAGAPVVPQPVPLHAAGVDTRAIDQARQSSHDLAQSAANKTPLIGDQANEEAGQTEKQAALQRDQSVEMQMEEQSQKDGLAEAQRVADQAHDEAKNFKFRDFIGSQTRGQKIVSNIAYFLGAFGAGGKRGNGINPVAQQIKEITDQQFREDSEKLHSKENLAKWKSEGVKDLASRYKDEYAKLQLRQGMTLKASADEAKAYLLRTGVPLQEADQNELVAKLRADGDKTYADGFEKLTHDKAMEALERVKLSQSQPEDPGKLAIIARAAQTPGVTQADLYELAKRLGIKDVNKSVLPVQKNPDAEDAATAKKQAALDARTVVLDGVPRGTLPSPRIIKPFTDRAIQYDDAIKSLEALKTDISANPIMGRLPTGDVYHRAVAAIAATTTGNVSDKMTEHEAGSIKNFGLTSLAAIDTAIEHLKSRQARFMGTLGPVGGEAPSSGTSNSMPSADKIRALPEGDRNDAIEATAALRNPEKAAKARKFLQHLGVM